MTDLLIRPCAVPQEQDRLVEIWRSAVDATHGFLVGKDRDEIEAALTEALFPQVELRVAERDGRIVGFSGLAGQSLEMLFVHADEHGRGTGSALLADARRRGVTRVDVNEQNPGALAFYRRRGFVEIGRSDRDGEGRPYPLLHLALASSGIAQDPGRTSPVS